MKQLPDTSVERLTHLGVRVVPKSGSTLMRWLGRLTRVAGNPHFVSAYWTTLGRTVYYPTTVRDPFDHPEIIEHELVHVAQWRRWGPWLWLSYLLLPLPVGLAWFRWRWEREAYLVQLAARPTPDEVDRICERLWRGYAWPWPRPWMRRWLERRRRELAGRGRRAD